MLQLWQSIYIIKSKKTESSLYQKDKKNTSRQAAALDETKWMTAEKQIRKKKT